MLKLDIYTEKFPKFTVIRQVCHKFVRLIQARDPVEAGADAGFSFGGGGGGAQKIMFRTHITSEEPNSLSAGVQGPLKVPGSST